ncbi:MAG: PAC2 family protein [Chloroflexi bacterium]|nr:PAC2 family protein [Chloroflexota bacterium]
MKLGAFELDEPVPRLKQPHALVMLQPWIDVGSVGTLTLAWLESQLKARDLGRLAKPGDFFDFTRYRPNIYIEEGQRHVAVPNTYATFCRRKTGNDFIFLHLLEPHSHSEEYIDSLVQLLEKFKVKRYCLIGSMYDLVPHTKPLLLTGRANGEKTEMELHRLGIEPSDYQGPTTITFLVSQRAPDIGAETMSLVVHLPQYTQLDDDYLGAARMMEVLSSMYDIPVDESYARKAEEQIQQINSALKGNPQLKGIVDELETRYEGRAQEKKEKETPLPRLSPQVEKFLREMERRFRSN